MEYRAVDVLSHEAASKRKSIKVHNYEEAMLLKSRLQAMIEELGDEMDIEKGEWSITSSYPRVGRFRSVICYIIKQNESQIHKKGNLTHQLQRFFGYPDTTDIWKIITHVRANPGGYEREIRLCRFFLIKHRVIDETPIEYYLVRRELPTKKYKGVNLDNQIKLFSLE